MILWVFIEFFGIKIVITDIYRYFTDILPIFSDIFRYFFRNSSTSTRVPQLRFFDGKIDFFRFFDEKSTILSIFPLFFLLGAGRKPIFQRYIDECLKHSYYTRISLAFSYCFGIIYIVLVLYLLFSVYFGIQA